MTETANPASAASAGSVVTPTVVDLRKIGEHRFQATNARGGTVTIGHGDDPDFTPVELLLAAIEACGALDIDFITGKRSEFAGFLARAQGAKVRDEQGNHVVGIEVTYDARFPEGEAGDAARAVLPSAIQKSQDRLCTVGRTVTLGSPVSYRPGELER
jgi:putative redox protein